MGFQDRKNYETSASAVPTRLHLAAIIGLPPINRKTKRVSVRSGYKVPMGKGDHQMNISLCKIINAEEDMRIPPRKGNQPHYKVVS